MKPRKMTVRLTQKFRMGLVLVLVGISLTFLSAPSSILAEPEPTCPATTVFSSRLDGAYGCTGVVSVNAPLRLSTPQVSRDENSDRVKRHMYGIENVLRFC